MLTLGALVLQSIAHGTPCAPLKTALIIGVYI